MKGINLQPRDQSSPQETLIGKTVGNYTITEEIGRGGMGIVYKATHVSLDKIVAVKVFSPKSPMSTSIESMEQVIRFCKEAQTQARLDHPNIVSVYDFLRFGDYYFIVMEYVQGGNLTKILSKHCAFEPRTAFSIFKQMLDGIGYAHSKGVIHRDIKPSNFILTPSHVKITDFGVSHLVSDASLTPTGAVFGTPKYMSPEQILGKETDHRSDIYSLGITFYEMLTGHVPFDSDNNSDFEIKRAHIELSPPSLSNKNPKITKELENIVLKAISKKPEHRFQSVDELMIALEKTFDTEKAKTFNGRDSLNLYNSYSINTTRKDSEGSVEYIPKESEFDEEGKLSETPYPNLLFSYYRQKRTGVLILNSDIKLRIFFYEGFLAFAEWGDPRLALGEMLVDRSIITKLEQKNSLSFARETGLKIGEALIKLKKITPYELSLILEAQVKEKLIDGFRKTNGFYRFNNNLELFEKVLYKIHPVQLIYEGLKRYADREKIVKLLQQRDYYIMPSPDIESEISNLSFFSTKDSELVDILSKKITFEEAITRSSLSIDDTLKFIYFLNLVELIHFQHDERELGYIKKATNEDLSFSGKSETNTEDQTNKIEYQGIFRSFSEKLAEMRKPKKISIHRR